jgi:Do/DeqQ family serine protease
MENQFNNSLDNIVITRNEDYKLARKTNWKLLSLLGVAVLFVGTVFGSIVTTKGWMPFAKADANQSVLPAVATGTTPALDANVVLNGGFSQIAKAVTPAVVTIEVSARETARRSPFGANPFRDFFGIPDDDQDEESTPRRRVLPNPNQQQTPQGRGRLVPNGVGSGVIVTGDGYIITNNHVVEGAEKVEVILNDRRQLTAKVIGTDPPSDLAIIKIEGSNFPTVAVGDSDAAQVGDLVLAVGYPLGVGQTVTMGIISAKGRSTGGSRTGRIQDQPYEDFIQTDAAINRGNSGGALVNLRGELIGIPSQILAGGSGGSIGIGFAIPAKMARNVMDQIVKGGKVRRGKLGVVVAPITPEFAKEFGYSGTAGALVQDTEKGQPADKAGIRAGDIITEVNGKRIVDNTELRNLVSQTAPGTPVKVKVWREGNERELTINLAEVEAAPKEKEDEPTTAASKGSGPLAGVSVDNLSPEKIRQYRLPEGTTGGVVVTDVDPNSDAANSGIRPGLVIIEVAKQPVTNVAEFNAAQQKLAGKKTVMLRVRDANGARFLLVQPQE